MTTTFTVAIPTHDRRELVTLAVRSALAQTRQPLEVVVLADGCSDGTAEALSALGDERVRVLELPKGPGYAYDHRNLALREARGDVVAWLGDDDLLFPDHLATIGEVWDYGDVELVQACAVQVDETGAMWLLETDWQVERFRSEAVSGHNRTPMSAVSVRPEAALAAGGWRGDRRRGGDIDLWARMIEAGARTRMSATPSVLNLLGSGRRQTLAERHRQSAACLEALADARAATQLRADASHAGQRQLAGLEQALEERTTQRDELVDRVGELERHLADAARELTRRDARLHDVLDSRWWRLRDRLLALPGVDTATAAARRARALSRRAG